MKIKNILTVSLACGLLPLALNSCDTEDPRNTNAEDSPAPSLQLPTDNDIIEYTHAVSIAPDAPFIQSLTFAGNKASTINSAEYTYTKTSEFGFSLVADFNPQAKLTTALGLTLGTISPEGNRLRNILFREEPIFSPAEIIEIINILNPPGAGLTINSEDPTLITTASNRTYNHAVTSTLSDLRNGIMAGNYNASQSGFNINFRRATPQEIAQFHPTLTAGTWIPFVTQQSTATESIESGRWLYNVITN